MRFILSTTTFALAAGLLLAAPEAGAQARAQARSGYKLVVNATNPVSELPAAGVSNLFLKKQVRWSSGETVLPVDQRDGAAPRAPFSQAVHRRSPANVQSYWQQQIFSGRSVPPPALPSDDAVLAYVARTPGAVGYVSADAPLGPGVKAVAVR